jgi:hypothetical protein
MLKKSASYNQIVANGSSIGKASALRKNISYHVIDETSKSIVDHPATLETWFVTLKSHVFIFTFSFTAFSNLYYYNNKYR